MNVQPGSSFYKSRVLPARSEMILYKTGESRILSATPEMGLLMGLLPEDFASSGNSADLLFSVVFEPDRNDLLTSAAHDMMTQPLGTEDSKVFHIRIRLRRTGEMRLLRLNVSHVVMMDGLHNFSSFEDVTESSLEISSMRLRQECTLTSNLLAPWMTLPQQSYAGKQFTITTRVDTTLHESHATRKYLREFIVKFIQTLRPSKQDMKGVQVSYSSANNCNRHSDSHSYLHPDQYYSNEEPRKRFQEVSTQIRFPLQEEQQPHYNLFLQPRGTTAYEYTPTEYYSANNESINGALSLAGFDVKDYDLPVASGEDFDKEEQALLAEFLLNDSSGITKDVAVNDNNNNNNEEHRKGYHYNYTRDDDGRADDTRSSGSINEIVRQNRNNSWSAAKPSVTVSTTFHCDDGRKVVKVNALDIRDYEYIDFCMMKDEDVLQGKPCIGTFISHILSDNDCSTNNDDVFVSVILNESGKKPRPIKNFPKVLYDVLEEPNHINYIKWQPHGRAFMLCNRVEFFSQIWPKYSKATTQANFIRQLAFWRFKRITKGVDSGCYYHPLFLRSKPVLLDKILSSKITGSTSAINHVEPDFYALSKKRPIP